MAGVEAPERPVAHAPAGAAPPRLGYIPALDGLRAVAVVAVLLYHGDQRWIPGGFLGVDVFFVISGYLITCLLLAEVQRDGHVGLGRFWYRRARRLLPALFTMLTVVSVYALVFLPDVVAQLRGEVLAAIFYVENWFLTYRHLSYFQRTGRLPLLQHVWSLAVEEQYYLVWPAALTLCLVVWGVRRRRMLAGILVAVVASTVWMAVLYHPYMSPDRLSRLYYGTDTRIGALLLGSALAFVWAPWRLRGQVGRNAAAVLDIGAVLGLAGLAVLFLSIHELDATLYRGGFLLAAVVSAVVVAVAVHPASRIAPRLLSGRVLSWIGIRSYGIYLWHWPVFMVTRPHADVSFGGLPLLALRFALTGAIAELSFRFVEQPVRNGAIERWVARYRAARDERRRRYRAGLAFGGVAGTAALVVMVAGFVGASPAKGPSGFPASGRILIEPHATDPTGPTVTAVATTAPTPGLVPAHSTAVGDSVMLGAANALADAVNQIVGPDTTRVDAAESRQFSAGVDLLKRYRDAGVLGDRVIVHLGTNGEVNPADFDRMMGILSGVKRVVIVNAKVPRPWEDEVNQTLSAGVRRYKNAVLADWHTYGGEHPEFFYDDGIHLRPSGQVAYAAFVAAALGAGTP